MLIWLSGLHLSIPEPNHTGILDPQTAEALRAFQRLNALPETGDLDRNTFKNLSKQFTLSAHHNTANPDK
jgi:peptidoglycan hydrolase-like protein with peptidoglycan-binding domain